MDPEPKNPGGGSGGGGDDDGPNVIKSVSGAYQIAGKQVVLLGRAPFPGTGDTPPQGPTLITILAGGDLTEANFDGKVDMRGAQGVRVTSGPPYPGVGPPTTSEATNGIEIISGETQTVTIQRGLIPGVDQTINMMQAGIIINAGSGDMTLQSMGPLSIVSFSEITLSVGPSSITLTPAGIIIQGPLIQIN